MREKYGEPLCDKAALEGDTPAKPSSSSNASPEAGASAAASAAASDPSPARNKLMPRMSVSKRWHSFPSVERLAQTTEAELKALGLGYRAKFIRNSAIKVVAAAASGGHADGSAYLQSLRSLSRDEVTKALLMFDGVGPKVADCVALFSLDQVGTVPVDTHVWRIACRDYDPTLSECKSLTPAVYARVGELFRQRFGEHAGWGHQILFAAELQEFRPLLPTAMLKQMEEAREIEQALKAADKKAKDARKAAKEAKGAGGEDEAVDAALAGDDDAKRRRLASGTVSKNTNGRATQSATFAKNSAWREPYAAAAAANRAARKRPQKKQPHGAGAKAAMAKTKAMAKAESISSGGAEGGDDSDDGDDNAPLGWKKGNTPKRGPRTTPKHSGDGGGGDGGGGAAKRIETEKG